MDMPANVSRELFTCCSSDISLALLHSGNRVPNFSRILLALAAPGGGTEGAVAWGGCTGGEGERFGGGVALDERPI